MDNNLNSRLNSESLEGVGPDYLRQEGILPSRSLEYLSATVIGAGGIGSPTVLALAKMGVPMLTVYDHDTVEPHNLPNQLYPIGAIGCNKARALAQTVREYSSASILPQSTRFEDQSLSGIVISGVDSMAARKEIWERVKWFKTQVPLYIEARMGAEVARVYTVRPGEPSHHEWYEQYLYDDDHAAELPCTERAIIYCTFMIASLIASQVKKYAMNQDLCKEIVFDLVTLTLLTQSE